MTTLTIMDEVVQARDRTKAFILKYHLVLSDADLAQMLSYIDRLSYLQGLHNAGTADSFDEISTNVKMTAQEIIEIINGEIEPL